jgi:peptidylprolyl isomerase
MSVFDLELVEIIAGDPPQRAPDELAALPVDATKTSTGLAYKMLVNAAGEERPSAWDRVTIQYTGWTTDGAMFETSHARDQPAVFDIAKVMPGWREALQLMSIGDRARVWIPEALAYAGRAGKPAGTVVFELELIAIERKPEPPRAPAEVAAPPRDATTTASGLAYRILNTKTGRAAPKAGDRVEVHYSAWTTDGALFDSSVVRGKPATLPLDRLIAGWAEGLMLMTEGSRALLWIPERLAYQGKPGAPSGMLVYEVELLRIVR